MPAGSMIVMERVSRAFDGKAGRVTALDGIDLEVGEREFVAVIGRSGCGKSTLLRLIAGLLAPTEGQVLVAGDPVTRPRRDVSVMFQRPALLPWRSVLANVMLPVEVLGLDRRWHAAAGVAVPLADLRPDRDAHGRAVLGAGRAHQDRAFR